MLEWQLYSLEMDRGGSIVGGFFEREGHVIRRVNPFSGREAELVAGMPTEQVSKAISDAINTDKKVLAVYGHGKFHHATYGLCKLADRLSTEYCYIHIDNHSDWSDENADEIVCGNFVGHILKNTNARVMHSFAHKHLIYIGAGASRCRGYGVDEIEIRLHDLKPLEQLLDCMPNDVYVTMDLDIMHPKEIRTAYTRGTLRKEELLNILKAIKSKKQIIGADILGYTPDDYMVTGYKEQLFDVRAFPPFRRKSLRLYKSIMDLLLG